MPKDVSEKMTAWLAKSGVPGAMFDKMKPWMVSMTVVMMEAQKTGMDPALGIDMHFLKAAKKDAKPVLELESVDGQLGLMASLSAELQMTMLKTTLDDAGETAVKLKQMTDAWRAGDVAGIEKIIKEPYTKYPEARPLMDKLFDERNVTMAAKIQTLLPEKKKIFVVVGAGHLVGEKGIPALLKAKGFTVEQLKGPSK